MIGLCTYLLIRGVTHLFVGLFAAGAFLHLIQTMGFLFLSHMAGGFSANTQYLPIISIVGIVGTIASAAAFISLTAFLLRPPAAAA